MAESQQDEETYVNNRDICSGKSSSICSGKSSTTPPTILFVGKCNLGETGNATTLNRLRCHAESVGYDCLMVDPEDSADYQGFSKDSLQELIQFRNVASAVGIHLYRSSPVLLACMELGIPYICYFGGTDLNVDVKSPEKLRVMTDIVFGARHLISFTEDMKKTALEVWNFLKGDSISILPQGITVHPNLHFDIEKYLMGIENENEIDISYTGYEDEKMERFETLSGSPCNKIVENDTEENKRKRDIMFNGRLKNIGKQKTGTISEEHVEEFSSFVPVSCCPSCKRFQSYRMGNCRGHLPQKYNPLIILVAGLRPVKDVLHVAEVFSSWQKERSNEGCLLIVGPVLDEHYAEEVKARAKRLNGVLLTKKLDPPDCQEVIRNATVLINTSMSEGMSAAILEAMALGTPVLARNILGNAAVIQHGYNGLLYDTPEAFVQELERLMQDKALTETLANNARDYIHKKHCAEVERKLFLEVLLESIFT